MPGRSLVCVPHSFLLCVLFVILPSAGLAFGPLSTPSHPLVHPALDGSAKLCTKPFPAPIPRASARGHHLVTMQQSAEGHSVSRTSEQLRCLIRRLQVANTHDANDPIAQIERYLRRVELKKNDVHDLAMNLAAEKALNCELDVEASECDVLSDARTEGWWKLSYSSHSLLLALIRTTNLYQKITMEEGAVKISNVVGDPKGLSAGLEGEAHHRGGASRTPRGRLCFRPRRAFLALSPRMQLRVPLPPHLPALAGPSAAAKDAKTQLEFYHDVLYSDDTLRVDWDASGGLDIFLHAGQSAEDVDATLKESAELNAWQAPGPGQPQFQVVPGQWLPSVLLAPLVAALLTLPLTPGAAMAEPNAPFSAFNAPFTSSSTAAPAQVRLAAAEEAGVSSQEAQEATVLATKKPMVSKEVGALLIAPLVVYRVWATINGQPVQASLDFSLLACLLSFMNRFL